MNSAVRVSESSDQQDQSAVLQTMSDMEQFPELELTKEDHDQIFEPPTDRQQPQNHHDSYR